MDSAERYRGDAGRTYHAIKRGAPAAVYPWIARLRARKFAAHVLPSDIVAEFGVGTGWNLAALNCARKLGYDVGEFLLPELAAHGIEFVTATKNIADASADLVICHHTLEHLLQPAEALREMWRWLGPGGTLLLHVPFEKERRYRRFRPEDPNHHLYTWNVQTLANLVTDCGFTVSRAGLRRYGYDRFAADWAHRWRAGESGYRALRAFLVALRPFWEVELRARHATVAPVPGFH